MVSQPVAPGCELLPWPRRCKEGEGSLKLSSASLQPHYRGLHSARVDLALENATAVVAQRSGLSATAQPATVVAISMSHASERYPGLEADESYQLEISARGIDIHADTEFGVLRALATLPQLVTNQGELRWLQIVDQPRFPWRGLLLDCARHYLPVAAIERTLRGMALCKLNVLHLHLTDDQAFRLPSSAFPKLPSAQHYSVAELRGLVELAADLGIRIVPELDMPGHVTCWLTAYPEWGSQPVAPSRRFGVHPGCLDPSREDVFQAIDLLLGELTDIFPDPCVHIGGDEVHPGWWSQDPRIVAFMKDRSMSDVGDLQAYFNLRVGELVEAHGRQVIAWDEVAHPQLPTRWLVQAWRGATTRDRLLQHGNRVVMSAPYYLDLHYPMDIYYQFDPAAPQAQLLAQEDALLEDPRLRHIAEGMRWTQQWRKGAVTLQQDESMAALTGAEACLWGELVDDAVLDQRLWSRLPALAERFWSETTAATAQTLYQRVEAWQHNCLPVCGINLAAQLRRQLAALDLNGDWQAIAGLLEPVKWYGRLLGEQALAARLAGSEMPQARPYDADVSLTGLADVLPPESLVWRQIETLILTPPEADAAAVADEARLRVLLQNWRDAAEADAAPAPLTPFLQPLARLAGLIADRLAGSSATESELQEIVAPRGELLLAVPPSIQRWLLAAA